MKKQTIKPAVKLTDVSKEYYVYKKSSERMKAVFLHKPSKLSRKALENINLEIQKGERVAILGQVASGRSTLLKIIAGIVTPSSGKAKIKGSVNPLFDLRSGFEKEFTGRMNLRTKAYLLGWKKSQIAEKEEEIIAFSELEQYIDLPIKSYGPGVPGRIGFAVHLATKRDIIVMDETLPTGSKVFKAKCLERIKEITEDPEVTLVMVTRIMAQARDMCERGIVLDEGHIIFDGPIEEAIATYRAMVKPTKKRHGDNPDEDMEDMTRDQDSDDDDDDNFDF